ncbi:MAG: hypothetical protein HFJ38_01490 [Bacilli bacterium]|nr:hypothetical protein [Bacilli bacterium]
MKNDNIFRPIDFENLDFLDTSFSNPIHLGFVVDRDYAFLFPKVDSDRHEDALYFLLRKKYGDDYKKFFSLFVDRIKSLLPDNLAFLVSLGKIVYINTGDFSFSSGLLMVPDNLNDFSPFQDKAFSKILSKIPQEDDFVISSVSSLEDIMSNQFYYTEDTVLSYLNHKHI